MIYLPNKPNKLKMCPKRLTEELESWLSLVLEDTLAHTKAKEIQGVLSRKKMKEESVSLHSFPQMPQQVPRVPSFQFPVPHNSMGHWSYVAESPWVRYDLNHQHFCHPGQWAHIPLNPQSSLMEQSPHSFDQFWKNLNLGSDYGSIQNFQVQPYTGNSDVQQKLNLGYSNQSSNFIKFDTANQFLSHDTPREISGSRNLIIVRESSNSW